MDAHAAQTGTDASVFLLAGNPGRGKGAPTAEDVAEMLDTVDAANVQATITELEELLATRRRAASMQEKLATVPPETLRAALVLRAQRRNAGQR